MGEWSTKAIRDAFYASPLLPRLLKGDVVRSVIADGVSQKMFGYARRTGQAQLRLEKFGESMAEMEWEIADDVYLLKAAEAQKLLEPPRPARLAVKPASIQVKPGDVVAFLVDGVDAVRPAVSYPGYVLDGIRRHDRQDRAIHCGGRQGLLHGHGRRRSPRSDNRRADRPRRGSGQARGRAAGRPPLVGNGAAPEVDELLHQGRQPLRDDAGLKLTIGLEVPVQQDQAKSKTDETKTALRDLGLPDDVT